MEKTVSPKMSSLAIDEREEIQERQTLDDLKLYVVESRYRSRGASLAPNGHSDEVISIGGRFTVSF